MWIPFLCQKSKNCHIYARQGLSKNFGVSNSSAIVSILILNVSKSSLSTNSKTIAIIVFETPSCIVSVPPIFSRNDRFHSGQRRGPVEKPYRPAHLIIHNRKKCSCKNLFDDSFHFSFSLCLLSLNKK